MDLDEALRQLRARLEDLYGERLKGLYLFGSRARGDAEPDSDVDVAVVLDDSDSVYREIRRMSEIGARTSLDLDLHVSPIPVREGDWREGTSVFLRNVAREGVPVH
ncbi:MAG: nucleotidyltransferase domain-containing protein [Armatimonadota bacterium]